MSKIEMPDTTADELAWKCWCGHWFTYNQREVHLATHKGEKNVRT